MARIGGAPLPTITDDSALGESVIQRSLRFRGFNSYLSRTPSSAGNRKTFTISFWFKMTSIPESASMNTIGTGVNNQNDFMIIFSADTDRSTYIHVLSRDSGSVVVHVSTNRVFRDPSAWYHAVISVDTTQSTSSDRVKIYINGSQETSLSNSTYPSQNTDLRFNSANAHYVGTTRDDQTSTGNFDGYMAEVNSIDGYAYDASYFGFTESQTGIWMPRRYEGAYGTNGFRLDFLDNSSAAALGIDKSPNGNDFTVNNHSVSASLTNDSMPDTPTNNFCVLNYLNKTTSFTGKDGGLTFDQTSNDQAITGTFFVTSGKWYWEFYKNSGHNPEIGISVVGRETLNNRSTGFIDGRAAFISNDGRIRTGSSSTANITGSSSGQTGAGWLRIACDMDNKKIWFSDTSGNYFNSGNPATGANPAYDFSSHEVADGWAPYICMTTANDGNGYFNFGQFDLNNFSSNIPDGFKTLTAQNLRDELLTSSGQSINPREHFAAITYTGAQSNTKITGLKFEPDMIWAKSRTQLYNHYIFDRLRGFDGSHLIPNSSAAEGPSGSDATALGGTTASGFFVSSASGISDSYQAPNNYIAWCWKAGGAAVSNSDGSITSSVSANQQAGFSIVSYTGTGSVATIGHGLGKKPDWIIVKNRTDSNNWNIYHSANGANYVLYFTTGGRVDQTSNWNDTEPTSTVFTVGTSNGTNGSSDNMIAYCWAEIPGYSKFGQYEGNANSDGPFIHLGFRPAWFMLTRVDSGDNWIIKDSARNTFNDVYFNLNPNSNGVQNGSAGNVTTADFVSNGVKIRGSDSGVSANGGTFVYMAFAEQPAVSSFTTMINAR